MNYFGHWDARRWNDCAVKGLSPFASPCSLDRPSFVALPVLMMLSVDLLSGDVTIRGPRRSSAIVITLVRTRFELRTEAVLEQSCVFLGRNQLRHHLTCTLDVLTLNKAVKSLIQQKLRSKHSFVRGGGARLNPRLRVYASRRHICCIESAFYLRERCA
jgi:hypothetical protein